MNRISVIRLEKDLSLEVIAERCVPRTTAKQIQRLEKGERKLTPSWIKRLSIAMDVRPSEIEEEIGLGVEIASLEKEERQELKNFLRYLQQKHDKHGTL